MSTHHGAFNKLIVICSVTYLATSNSTRSACSLACKCSYVPDPTTLPSNSPHLDPNMPANDSHPPVGWQPAFFRAIGLQSIVENDFKQLGGPTPRITPNLSPGHSHRVHEFQEGNSHFHGYV